MSHPGLNSPSSPPLNAKKFKKSVDKLRLIQSTNNKASVPLPPFNSPSGQSEETSNSSGEQDTHELGQQHRKSNEKDGLPRQTKTLSAPHANKKGTAPKQGQNRNKNETSHQKDSLEHQPGRLKKSNQQPVLTKKGPKTAKKLRQGRGQKGDQVKNKNLKTHNNAIASRRESELTEEDGAINTNKIDGIPPFQSFSTNESLEASRENQAVDQPKSDNSLANVLAKVSAIFKRKPKPIRSKSLPEISKIPKFELVVTEDLSAPIITSAEKKPRSRRHRSHSLLSHSNLPLSKHSNLPDDGFHRPTFTIDDEIIFQDVSVRRHRNWASRICHFWPCAFFRELANFCKDNPDFYRLTPNHPLICPRCNIGKFRAEWTPLSMFCCICVPVLGIPCYFAFREYTCSECGEIWEYNDPREEIDALP